MLPSGRDYCSQAGVTWRTSRHVSFWFRPPLPSQQLSEINLLLASLRDNWTVAEQQKGTHAKVSTTTKGNNI
eukprot:1198140-Amphidinium_carterae.1